MDAASRARQARLEELFERALAIESSDRSAWIEALDGQDAGLRGELAELLAAADESSRFLAVPLVHAEDAARRSVPERIGPFRVLRELGAGGMGVVYLAEQERPRRQVALKVLRPGVAIGTASRRFEREAELLARLQHPGIARVFEAGTTDWGAGAQPYIAMELVEGANLTEHAARERLDDRARIALLADVCDALEHAHRRGVIHRDVKPSNVLVDTSSGRPQVKVLDFGVARATTSDLRATTLLTDPGHVVGTVAYMSPEQAGGDPSAIDERSDVYALGVIGYELLAGRLPVDVVGKPLHAAVRAVREDEPVPLSRVRRDLRGDVETILAKALEKDPDRRYASAADLASDLRRHLADQPVIARPASSVERVAKFARRNRALVSGTAAVMAALVVGLVATLRQARLAAGERDRAELAAVEADRSSRRANGVLAFQREMLARVQPGQDGRGVTLASVLDSTAAALPGSLAQDPAVEAGVRTMLGDSYHALGMLQQAETQYTRAIELDRDSLGPTHDDTLRAQAAYASLVADLGRTDEALNLVESTLAQWVEHHGRADPDALALEFNRIDLLAALGRDEDAERVARECVATRRSLLGADDPRTLTALTSLAQVLATRGSLAEAETLVRDAFERGTRVQGERHPDSLTREALLANTLLESKHVDEAERHYRHAIDVGRDVLGATHFELLVWEHNLAALLERRGDLSGAESLYRAVVAAQAEVFGAAHSEGWIARRSLAACLEREGRHAEAEELLGALVEEQVRGGADAQDVAATRQWLDRAHEGRSR